MVSNSFHHWNFVIYTYIYSFHFISFRSVSFWYWQRKSKCICRILFSRTDWSECVFDTRWLCSLFANNFSCTWREWNALNDFSKITIKLLCLYVWGIIDRNHIGSDGQSKEYTNWREWKWDHFSNVFIVQNLKKKLLFFS